MNLTDSGGKKLRSVVTQPKRLALLVYLAMEGTASKCRRDTLLGIFWPDLDDQAGRQALRQAVYVLRRALGASTILSDGHEQLGVDDEALWCDATAVIRAAANEDAATVLNLYKGDFLPGFFLEEAQEFEQWVYLTRLRLQSTAADMAWKLAVEEEDRGNAIGAAHWARQAADFQPDDDASVRRLIELLDRVGDRASAIRTYEKYVGRLKKDLALEPSAELQDLALRIRARTEGVPEVPARAHARDVVVEQPSPDQTDVETEGPPSPPVRNRLDSRWRRLLATSAIGVLVCGAVLIGLGLMTGWFAQRAVTDLDSDVIVVLPFRVSGAVDELGYLGEGMVELLGAVLTGEGGPRAADPGAVLSRWRRAAGGTGELSSADAFAIARDLGAGRVLTGGLAGTATQLIANVTLYDVESGSVIAQATSAGIADSLPRLVDALLATVLTGIAGEPRDRIADLVTRSPEALRAYLDGQRAFRRGEYQVAVERLHRAITIDSTFALAFMPLIEAAGFETMLQIDGATLYRLAWAQRDRLSPRDHAWLLTIAGPNYPEPSSRREQLPIHEMHVALAPDRPESWYGMGDQYFHWGRILGFDDALEHAAGAFEHALRLDSVFAPAAQHRIEIALSDGDSVKARHLTVRLPLRSDSLGYVSWLVAHMEGDLAQLERMRSRFAELSPGDLIRIWHFSQEVQVSVEDAETATREFLERAVTAAQRAFALDVTRILALNRGRPEEALTASLAREEVFPGVGEPARRVLHGLYWEGEPDAARTATSELDEILGTPAPEELPDRANYVLAACVRGLWRTTEGQKGLVEADQAVLRLREWSSVDEPGFVRRHAAYCSLLLEAILATYRVEPDASVALERLEGMTFAEPPIWEPLLRPAGLIIAHLHERNGEIEEALASLRRRPFLGAESASYLSSYLREEGRLAAANGNLELAIRAYRHYLGLRSHPEAILEAEVSRVKDELARLEGR